jgi:hypothetical protein
MPPPRPPRHSGVSAGRVILFGVVLLAVAVSVWWFEYGRFSMAVPKVSSGKAMSPDQEVFNAICLLATGSEEYPSFWGGSVKVLSEYDQSQMRTDTKELLSDTLSRCEELRSLEIRIAQRKEAGEQEVSAIKRSSCINGVAGGAMEGVKLGTELGTGKGAVIGGLVFGVLGLLDSNAKSDIQTAPIIDEMNRDIAEMKRQMAVLVKGFGPRLDEYRATKTFKTFDPERIFDEKYLSLGDSAVVDQESRKTLDAAFCCKVPELCAAIDYKSSTHLNKQACYRGLIVEWPKSRIVDAKMIIISYSILAVDACDAGRYKESIALADEGLKIAPRDANLLKIRKEAESQLAKPKNALNEVEMSGTGKNDAKDKGEHDLEPGLLDSLFLEMLAL